MEDINALIEKAKAGDRQAFGKIYQLYYNRIYRFTFYLVFDELLADDITQNTFLKMWYALPKFKTQNGSIQSYLFTIARNLVTDHKRKKKEYKLDLALNISHEDNLIDKITNHEKEVILHKLLKKIDKDERQLLILRFFEDFSFHEISSIVNKKEGAIRVQTSRLLKKLKQIFLKNYAN